MKGKSYLQEERTTQETYKDDVMQLEYCHNLIAQVHPNPIDDVKYATSHAMLIARVMNELSSKITRQGASFAQQHLLHKGLKVFGRKGHEASAKEIKPTISEKLFHADIGSKYDYRRKKESDDCPNVSYRET